MLRVAIVIAVAGLTIVAVGQEAPGVVEACKRAAALQFGVNTVVMDKLQAFPDLSPPRVRFTAFGLPEEDAPGASAFDALAIAQGKPVHDERGLRNMGDVRCEFDSAARPYRLVSFACSAFSCFVNDARVEELRDLLAREGY